MANWLALNARGGLRGNAGASLPTPTPTPTPTPADSITNIAPGLGWAGTATTAGSPVDQDGGAPRTVSTYAKPGAAILTEPGFLVVDGNDLIIGAHAYAGNAAGPLPVVAEVWIENATFAIPFGSWTYTDKNGNLRTIWGYFARIKHASFTQDGKFNVKWNFTVPSDATFQNRTLGPFTYTRVSSFTGYDYDVQVGTGRTYTTLVAAFNALQAAGAKNPRITLMDTASYQLGGSTTAYVGDGYCTIRATSGVTAHLYRTGDQTSNLINYYGLRLEGSNVKVDMAMHPPPATAGRVLDVFAYANDSTKMRPVILDGCQWYCSTGLNSKEAMEVGAFQGGSRGGGFIILDDCHAHDLLRPLYANPGPPYLPVYLIRNMRMSNVGGADCIEAGMYNIYGLTLDGQSMFWFQDETTNQAGLIQYSTAVGGAATTATWQTDHTAGDKAANLILKKDGSTVVTIPLTTNGTNGFKSMADLKVDIEANSGWTFTVQNDIKYAHYLAISKAQATAQIPVPATNCLNITSQVYTLSAAHSDLWQPVASATGPIECILGVNIRAFNMHDSQQFFMGGSTNGFNDCFFINMSVGGYAFATFGGDFKAQFGNPMRHCNWWHCGFLDEVFFASSTSADAYSSIRGSMFYNWSHIAGFASTAIKFDGNFMQIRTNAPPNETNSKNVGSTVAALINNQAIGDFTEKTGAGLATVASLVPFDVNSSARGATSRIGALA